LRSWPVARAVSARPSLGPWPITAQKVVIGDLLEGGDELLAQGLGASAKYVHLDVTRPDDWETVAMNRVGGPIETANLAVFLASEESSLSTRAEFIADSRKRLPLLPCVLAWDHGRSINGETIAIDGGSLTRG
jgi:hypothetical protein